MIWIYIRATLVGHGDTLGADTCVAFERNHSNRKLISKMTVDDPHGKREKWGKKVNG